MLRFQLFGIPIGVQPFFWLMATFVTGGLQYLQNGKALFAVVGILVVFISVLLHELGHALVGRKLAGGQVHIMLWGMGGLAYNQGGRFDQKSRALMIAAGPGFGFGLFLLTCIAAFAIWPDSAWQLILTSLGFSSDYTLELYEVAAAGHYIRIYLFELLLWINFWWGILNLIPVFPLDGGQLLQTFMRSHKRVHLIGMILAGIVIVASAAFLKSIFLPILFAFLAFQNYQAYQQAQY